MIMMTHTEMDGLQPIEQASRAISYVLERIRTDPDIGWNMGFGTQAFSLLTEAMATLDNAPVVTVRERFLPLNPRDPSETYK